MVLSIVIALDLQLCGIISPIELIHQSKFLAKGDRL